MVLREKAMESVPPHAVQVHMAGYEYESLRGALSKRLGLLQLHNEEPGADREFTRAFRPGFWDLTYSADSKLSPRNLTLVSEDSNQAENNPRSNLRGQSTDIQVRHNLDIVKANNLSLLSNPSHEV